MPRMDGYSATKGIRSGEQASGLHTPIIALTAHAMASDEERCLASGMDAYLTKPANKGLLVATIKKCMQAAVPSSSGTHTSSKAQDPSASAQPTNPSSTSTAPGGNASKAPQSPMRGNVAVVPAACS